MISRTKVQDGKWRQGKVRPLLGNSPLDRPVSRGISFTIWRICDDPSNATPFPQWSKPYGDVFQAWRNLSGPMWCSHQTPGRDRAASRWSAPSPGSRTCREDHALAHRPRMSSGRLFLDQVGRHQSPSPLHRHEQINTHSQPPQAKGDISTLPARGHFYFAATIRSIRLTSRFEARYHTANVLHARYGPFWRL